MSESTTQILPVQHPSASLTRFTIFVMAAACAASVANIYYNQPLLDAFAHGFHTTIAKAGLVATAAQVGYGAGLLAFVPLGDILPRKKIVVGLAYCCAAVLCCTALAHSLAMLIVLQLLVGLSAVSPQLLIPFAVELSNPAERGRVVGTMMAGLLTGLLLARTVSGVVADNLGWRAMFWIAAALMLATALVLQFVLPSLPAAQRIRYSDLIKSLWVLVRRFPVLRRASSLSALSFASFCAFWAVLSFLMSDRFHMGPTQTGSFGLVGLAGALCAPLAGRLSDRRGSNFTLTIATLITVAAFLEMYLWLTILGLVVGVVLLDLGVQATQVAAQAEVVSLAPDARNRLNTVYMVCRFAGGAAGSAAGTFTYAHAGWLGTCALCVASVVLGLGIHLRGSR